MQYNRPWASLVIALVLAVTACGADSTSGKSSATTAVASTQQEHPPVQPHVLPTTASSGTTLAPNCSKAKLLAPSDPVVRGGPVRIDWQPDSCIMDFAYYQYSTLKAKLLRVHSGDLFDITPPPVGGALIDTELKIWRPGDASPADSIWIQVTS